MALSAAVLLIQALAPIAVDLAVRIVEEIKKDDLTSLTPEDWLELLKHSQLSADGRLAVIIKKHFTP